jgi:hypothetical protein
MAPTALLPQEKVCSLVATTLGFSWHFSTISASSYRMKNKLPQLPCQKRGECDANCTGNHVGDGNAQPKHQENACGARL